jgi:hypothetical protein
MINIDYFELDDSYIGKIDKEKYILYKKIVDEGLKSNETLTDLCDKYKISLYKLRSFKFIYFLYEKINQELAILLKCFFKTMLSKQKFFNENINKFKELNISFPAFLKYLSAVKMHYFFEVSLKKNKITDIYTENNTDKESISFIKTDNTTKNIENENESNSTNEIVISNRVLEIKLKKNLSDEDYMKIIKLARSINAREN